MHSQHLESAAGHLEIDVHGKEDRHMKLLTLEKESSLGSPWDQEQCAQFCSKDELWEAAKEEEMKRDGRRDCKRYVQ